MISRVFTATTRGIDTQLIEVEVDISNSLPQVVVVGLPDKSVQESKERLKSAIKHSEFEFPVAKVTINLAPAGVSKEGAGFDLAMAVGILKNSNIITQDLPEKAIFIGELSLDGSLRSARGVLNICLWAKENGFENVFIPQGNSQEGAVVSGIKIWAIDNLATLVELLNQHIELEPIKNISIQELIQKQNPYKGSELLPNDMAYVRGQQMAKRALEIAAAGGHNTMFIGAPGSGKTLLARAYTTILPRLSESEVIEVTRIYSSAGLLSDGKLIIERPFRAPHHSASHIALVGGGSHLKPGEISLAHRGVLFLDEFPEFKRETIEVLRQPLEDGFITISRASGTITYPSKFYLLAAANPTPSGFDLSDPLAKNKPQFKSAIARYQSKFSGPIIDRIDLHVQIDRPKKEELESQILEEPSSKIRQRVQAARDIQTQRFSGKNIFTNAEMNLPQVKKYCILTESAQKILSQAIDKFNLSGRGYIRLLKISRTIADLDNSEVVDTKHIAEALQFRPKILEN